MAARKKVFIVYAHHNEKSFNAALRRVAVETLKEQGCDVTVSDLYAMNYDPIIGKKDIKGELPGHFNYSRKIAEAWVKNLLREDIVEEQRKLKQADLVIFMFPIQWSMVPAILKGWIERTFIGNFSCPLNEVGMPVGYNNSNLAGKKALICLTTGATPKYYSPEGRHGDFRCILYPFQTCVLQANGLVVYKPQIHYYMDVADDVMRNQYLADWRRRLAGIWDEEPIPCIPNSEFDEDYVLKKDSKFRRAQFAPNIGIHLGKPLAKL